MRGKRVPERKRKYYAGVAELADAPDLGSGGQPRAGSSPVTRILLRKKYHNIIVI